MAREVMGGIIRASCKMKLLDMLSVPHRPAPVPSLSRWPRVPSQSVRFMVLIVQAGLQMKDAEVAEEVPKMDEPSMLPGWGMWAGQQREPKWMRDARDKAMK